MPRWLALLGVFAAAFVVASGAEDDVKGVRTIVERCRAALLEQAPPSEGRVKQLMESLGEDGRWPDVDYGDADRARWGASAHLSYVSVMARAWVDPRHPRHGDARLKGAIDRSLGHWLEVRYRNPNSWWWNEIGVPRTMREVAVLLWDDLTEAQRTGTLEVIGQTVMGGTGANLAWTAELQLHHDCLAGDSAGVARAAAAIHGAVVVGEAQGIQDDASFFQHHARLQAFAYGRAFLETLTDLAWQLDGTPWELPPDKCAILSGYMLDGLQWMCRGTYTVPSTLDREVSRLRALHKADLRRILRRWLETEPPRRTELEALLACQEGRGAPLVGHRHFPRADFTVHHRPSGSFFLKTISDRTLPTESINHENLKGGHLHTGDHYVLRDGEEYYNLPPVWDWDRLPGVTLADGAPPLQRRAFVGGVSNGQSGLTTMDCAREGERGERLNVRKAWAFHGDLMVCLMSGWHVGGLDGEPRTALDQCRLRGPVLVQVGAGPARELAEGRHEIENLTGLLHAGVAYVPLAPADVTLRLGPATGSWRSINRSLSERPVTEPVFLAVMHHGQRPPATGFVIAVGADADTLADLIRRPSWRVLRNDARVQAVRFDDGTHMAAFHEPGALAADGATALKVDRPCLALWTGGHLWLCDPTGAGGTTTITWQGKQSKVDLPAGGCSTHVESSPTD